MRIYLAVTFWGEEYRRYFLDFCLASLLAPGNIPAIVDKPAARLLIATTDRDWQALQVEPTFKAAKELISVEHVPLRSETESVERQKMQLMSDGHRQLARRMFHDKAHGVFTYPDMLAADGMIAKLQELWQRGFSVVMFMNVRYANEGIIREIKEQGLCQPGKALALSTKALVRMTIRHMHSELQRCGFENRYDDYGCSAYFWPVAQQQDLLFHCGSWIPLLIDYGAIEEHDDSTFDSWTLDGDYVAKNFTDKSKIYFARDTDELLMISFSPEANVHYSLAREPRYRVPFIRSSLKVIDAHYYLYAQSPQWFAKDQFRLPVWFRGGNSPASRWSRVERQAAKLVARIERGGSLRDKAIYVAYFRIGPVLRSLWTDRQVIFRRIGQVVRGDRSAWRRVMWRLRRQLASHPQSDMQHSPPD